MNTFNGTDLAGRKIMVREDREDRDVKQYNRYIDSLSFTIFHGCCMSLHSVKA